MSRRAYLIPVSAELLATLGEWSEPVQVRVVKDDNAIHGYTMEVRTAAPMTRWHEGAGLWLEDSGHKARNAAARARGECYDCGQPLTSPGAPGICAAGHTPDGPDLSGLDLERDGGL